MSTTTDFQKITEQISVPTNLVDAAITQGIQATAPRRKQHRRRITIGLAVAVLLLGAAITPATIQAGGIVPAFTQLLDQDGAKTHNFDPTMNMLLGNLYNQGLYDKVSVPAQRVGNVQVQPIGTLSTAGVVAVLIDYTGPGMQPDQLRRQTEQVDQVSGQHIIDTESNFGKVALGHYRQVIAFYTQGTAPVQAINLQLGKINGTQQTLAFKQLPVKQRALQKVTIDQSATVKATQGGQITGRLNTVQFAPEALVVNYSVDFDKAGVSGQWVKNYSDAAWISSAYVYAGKQYLGELEMGAGGQFLHTQTTGNHVTSQFQSVFAKQYSNGWMSSHALTDAPAGSTVKFVMEIPTTKPQRQHLGTFTVPVRQLLTK
ncbi:hypothetical protein [Schleiferilactobacillus harbinensis]|uniref:DUF4179 domain-containing protein n=1 Tax=Schleiferilactobacillus harbinensis TaxID=304207 RepID=A0ABU7SXM7_9LACO